MPDNSRTVHAVLSNNCSFLHWVRQNLHSSQCVDQNNTLVTAGKESDVTEAKLKTSRVITKQLHAPSTAKRVGGKKKKQRKTKKTTKNEKKGVAKMEVMGKREKNVEKERKLRKRK